MKKFLSTLSNLTKGYHLLYWANYIIQFFMVFVMVFTSFLGKVMIDALSGYDILMKDYILVEAWVVQIITMGNGPRYLCDNLWILPLALILSAILSALFSSARMWLRSYTNASINKGMQYKLFTHLEKLPYSYYKKHRSGDLIQTCTRDLDVIRKFMMNDVGMIFYTFDVVVLCFAILMSVNIELTLISLSFLPIMFVYSFFLIKEVRKRYRATDDSEARMTDKIAENLSAVRIVKAFNNESFEIDSFEECLTDYKKHFIHWRIMSSFFFSSSDIFIFGSKLMALLFGLYLCFTRTITAGTLFLSFTFIEMMVWPLRDVATILSNMGQYMASADRVVLILDVPLEDTWSGEMPKIQGDITFDHAGFTYDDGTVDVIKDVSFHIAPGQTVAIMGKTGSGKSTLSLLLTRLYDYTSGSIKIDGTELRDIKKSYLRRNIVPVLQDPFLFSKSISENIKMARKNATEEDIQRAAHIASIDGAIAGFKEGYGTPVGEKGVTLSGGQKQRVAIARTIVSNAPVIIFDDSLSAVDTETDLRIRQNLKELEKNTTTIIITHRVSTAKDADLIVVLDNGTIAQSGNHDQLIKEEGLYKRVYEIQSQME